MKLGRWVAGVALVLFCALLAVGQPYPNKTVHVIVPFTAGSATDILARTFGQKLSEMWGQPVDRRKPCRSPAAPSVRRSSRSRLPTATRCWCIPRRTPTTRRSIRPCPYDTAKDFVEVVPLAGQPNVLVVSPSAGVKSVAELIALAKQKPGQLNFGSAGTGSGTHINAEKFKLAAGIDVVHIPYKGTPEALNDTMAGRVTYFFSPISAALPNVRDGQAAGARREHRRNARARCPTCRPSPKSGLPGFDYNLWVGVFAPAGTPPDIVDKINKDVDRVAAVPRDQGTIRQSRRRADADDARRIQEFCAAPRSTIRPK